MYRFCATMPLKIAAVKVRPEGRWASIFFPPQFCNAIMNHFGAIPSVSSISYLVKMKSSNMIRLTSSFSTTLSSWPQKILQIRSHRVSTTTPALGSGLEAQRNGIDFSSRVVLFYVRYLFLWWPFQRSSEWSLRQKRCGQQNATTNYPFFISPPIRSVANETAAIHRGIIHPDSLCNSALGLHCTMQAEHPADGAENTVRRKETGWESADDWGSLVDHLNIRIEVLKVSGNSG